ncbi:MAG: hypothetical protein KC996_05450 [Phycisphaerales bacterium]|nr:hypothetical protein [Phycisphaerales bacterium]
MRWAQQSLQNLCLENAEAILQSEANDPLLSTTPWMHVVIADQLYAVSIADEQSKTNIAFLLGSHSLQQAADSLHTLAPTGRANLIQLRLAQGKPDPADPKLLAYDQLWLEMNPEDLFGDGEQPGFQQRVTLWGDGRINLRRASADAATEALRGALTRSETLALLQFIQNDPEADPLILLEQMDLSGDQKAKAAELIAQESRCYSVTLRTEHAGGNPGWRFAVQCMIEHDDPEGSHRQTGSENETMETRVWVQLW